MIESYAFAILFTPGSNALAALAELKGGAIRIELARALADAVIARLPISTLRVVLALDALSSCRAVWGARVVILTLRVARAFRHTLIIITEPIRAVVAIAIALIFSAREIDTAISAFLKQFVAGGKAFGKGLTAVRRLRACDFRAFLGRRIDIEDARHANTRPSAPARRNARQSGGTIVRGLARLILQRESAVVVVVVALAAPDEGAEGGQAQGSQGATNQ